jgi:hypothetical protein
MWKGEIIVYFKVVHQLLAAGCGGSDDKPQSGKAAYRSKTDSGTFGIFKIN